MVVKIRLARFGNRHSPIYNIVVAHARTAPSSLPLEVLGTYDPTPRIPLATSDPSPSSPSSSPTPTATPTPTPRRYKAIQLDSSRVKYWLGVGAQPSDSVRRMLGMVGLMENVAGNEKEKSKR